MGFNNRNQLEIDEHKGLVNTVMKCTNIFNEVFNGRIVIELSNTVIFEDLDSPTLDRYMMSKKDLDMPLLSPHSKRAGDKQPFNLQACKDRGKPSEPIILEQASVAM